MTTVTAVNVLDDLASRGMVKVSINTITKDISLNIIQKYCTNIYTVFEQRGSSVLVELAMADPFLSNNSARDFLSALAIANQNAAAAFDPKVIKDSAHAITSGDMRINPIELWNIAGLADRIGFHKLHGYYLLLFAEIVMKKADFFEVVFDDNDTKRLNDKYYDKSTRIDVKYFDKITRSSIDSVRNKLLPTNQQCVSCGETSLGTCGSCKEIFVCSAACLQRVHSECFAVNIVPGGGRKAGRYDSTRPKVNLIGHELADPRAFLQRVLVPLVTTHGLYQLISRRVLNDDIVYDRNFYAIAVFALDTAANPNFTLRNKFRDSIIEKLDENSARDRRNNDPDILSARSQLLALVFSDGDFKPDKDGPVEQVVDFLAKEYPKWLALSSYVNSHIGKWEEKNLQTELTILHTMDVVSYLSQQVRDALFERYHEKFDNVDTLALIVNSGLRSGNDEAVMSIIERIREARPSIALELRNDKNLLGNAVLLGEQRIVSYILRWFAASEDTAFRELSPAEVDAVRKYLRSLNRAGAKLSAELSDVLAYFRV